GVLSVAGPSWARCWRGAGRGGSRAPSPWATSLLWMVLAAMPAQQRGRAQAFRHRPAVPRFGPLIWPPEVGPELGPELALRVGRHSPWGAQGSPGGTCGPWLGACGEPAPGLERC